MIIIRDIHISTLILANILRVLLALMFLLLVPLLYLIIFRARKKHAMAKGKKENIKILIVIIHQGSLRLIESRG